MGASLVEKLLKPGNKIISIARSSSNSACTHMELDLAKTDLIPQLIASIFKDIDSNKSGSITLINNAGILSPISRIDNASSEEIALNLSINLIAPIVLTSEFIKMTRDFNCKKLVVNISTGAAIKPYEGWSLYGSAKSGLEHFTRTAALEQQRAKYPACLINANPGVMDTNMQNLIRNTSVNDFPAIQRFLDLKKNNQLADPDNIAELLIKGILSNNLISGKTYKIQELLGEKL